MAIMRYLGSNGGIVGGSIKFKGRDIRSMSEEELRQMRGAEVAMIYKEPMAAQNPSLTNGVKLLEVPIIHAGVPERVAYERARQLHSDGPYPEPDRKRAQ